MTASRSLQSIILLGANKQRLGQNCLRQDETSTEFTHALPMR
jgi:hypothetical protein